MCKSTAQRRKSEDDQNAVYRVAGRHTEVSGNTDRKRGLYIRENINEKTAHCFYCNALKNK